MSYQVLKRNLESIIKQKCLNITELERKAGLKKNNIYNITRGLSKNPSVETIQRIADALGITLKELYKEDFSEEKYENNFLNHDHLKLLDKVVSTVVEEVINLDLRITENRLINVVIEVFRYQKQEPKEQIDKKFINWMLHKESSF